MATALPAHGGAARVLSPVRPALTSGLRLELKRPLATMERTRRSVVHARYGLATASSSSATHYGHGDRGDGAIGPHLGSRDVASGSMR